MSTETTTVKRSTARDGLANKVQFRLLTGCGPLWRTVQRIDPLERVVNRVLINKGVMKAPPRPYRLSTLSDYTSMESLTTGRTTAASLRRWRRAGRRCPTHARSPSSSAGPSTTPPTATSSS